MHSERVMIVTMCRLCTICNYAVSPIGRWEVRNVLLKTAFLDMFFTQKLSFEQCYNYHVPTMPALILTTRTLRWCNVSRPSGDAGLTFRQRLLIYLLLCGTTCFVRVPYRLKEPASETGHVFSYKLRYIVGFWLVEMAISTNQKPTIYRNLYENTGPELIH